MAVTSGERSPGHPEPGLQAGWQFYSGGRLKRRAALPVLSDNKSAPLRFSHAAPSDSPERIAPHHWA